MINRFLDHTANERTYLSWISAAIGIMAFGFVIERFDIFITYVAKMLGGKEKFQHSYYADIVGIGLLVIGAMIVIVATIRFIMFKKAIDSDKELPYGSVKAIILLSLLMILLGCFLVFYLWHNIHK